MAERNLSRRELKRQSEPTVSVQELGTRPGDARAILIGSATVELLRVGKTSARLRVTTPRGTEVVRVKIAEEQAAEAASALSDAA